MWWVVGWVVDGEFSGNKSPRGSCEPKLRLDGRLVGGRAGWLTGWLVSLVWWVWRTSSRSFSWIVVSSSVLGECVCYSSVNSSKRRNCNNDK